MTRWKGVAIALWLGESGCAHELPLRPGAYTPGVPPGTGALVRLTFNPRADLSPVWLPDGTGFLYTMERTDTSVLFERPDRDRCLAQLPAAGGSIVREICDRTPAAGDSVNAYTSPAVTPDGRVAYVRASAPLDVGWPLVPRYHELVLASLDDPQRVTVLRTLPYTGPSGREHAEATQLRWVGDSVLVYVGQRVAYIPPCQFCPPDTVASGTELVRLDFRGPGPVLTMLPGSDQASSVAVAAPDTLYFTVNGDSRVFSLSLSTDSIDVVHDFGSGGIARDVQVAGRKLVAVVGGNVAFLVDPVVGAFQRDSGGPLMLVNLDTGAESPLGPSLTFRHPALEPSGMHVVAELVSGRTTDLWLLEVP